MVIFIRFFANILGLYLANIWVSGFAVIDGWQAYLVAGIVLGLLNLIIRPILKIITFPLVVISLGLFLIVINAIIIWLTAQLTGYIVIESYVALLWATIVIAAVNFIVHWLR